MEVKEHRSTQKTGSRDVFAGTKDVRPNGVRGSRLESVVWNRFESGFFCLGVGYGLGGLELAVDGYIGILIEAGIGFETGFRLGTAYEDIVIMVQEANVPFEGSSGVVMLEGVGLALGFFDEVSVGYACFRPMRREMVGVELEETASEGSTTSNDMFLIAASFFESVDFSEVSLHHGIEFKVPHPSGVRRDSDRIWNKSANIVLQTANYVRF